MAIPMERLDIDLAAVDRAEAAIDAVLIQKSATDGDFYPAGYGFYFKHGLERYEAWILESRYRVAGWTVVPSIDRDFYLIFSQV